MAKFDFLFNIVDVVISYKDNSVAYKDNLADQNRRVI